MSNHNYSKYSSNKKNQKTDAQKKSGPIVDDLVPEETTKAAAAITPIDVNTEVVVEPVEVKMEVDTVDTVTLPSEVTGVVVNCSKLNIRSEASRNGKVVTIVNSGSTLYIDTIKSDNEWLCVCTDDGVIGYCMRQYVDAKL